MSSDRAAAGTHRPLCPFCGAADIDPIEKGAFHPVVHDHGPFDLYRCRTCGSALTSPLPSTEALARLYGSFVSGLPPGHRAIEADDPQAALYQLFVRRVRRLSGRGADEAFRWIDAGAGDGVLSREMARVFPRARGLAIDQHPRPESAAGANVLEWRVENVNRPHWSGGIEPADVVMAVAVWEHVTDPARFVEELLRLTRPGGLLYLVCPDFGSLARRVMRHRWPYYSPGEHLFMPSPAGAESLLRRASGASVVGPFIVSVRRLWLPYTAKYVLRRLGAGALSSLVPAGLAVPVPAGALESTIRRA